MIVHVHHPAPVRLGPEAGSGETLRFARAVTPARLNEASRGDFRKVAAIRGHREGESCPLMAHAGRLWRPLAPSWGYAEPVAPAHFLAWLSDPGHALGIMLPLLHRTPLCAHDPGAAARGEYAHRSTRGRDLPEASARRVVEDGTDRARADLLRFLEEDVVLTSDRVYVRAQGPLAVFSEHKAPEDAPGFFLVDHPDARGPVSYAVRIDRLGEYWDHACRLRPRLRRTSRPPVPVPGDPEPLDRFLGPLEGLPAELLRDDDVRAFAETAAIALPAITAAALGRAPADPEARQRAEGTLRRLRSWRVSACLGATRPDELEPLLRDVASYVADLHLAHPHSRRDARLREMAAYLEGIALPRLAPVVADEDQAALDALLP